MTSNVVASELNKNKYIGFTLQEEGQAHKDMKEKVTSEMKKVFRPEFLNRIDETIVFHSLEKKHMSEIVKLMIAELKERLSEKDIEFTITDRAIEKIRSEERRVGKEGRDRGWT